MKFDHFIDKYRNDIIINTQNLVRIRSVEEEPTEGMPFGRGPYRALCYVLELGKSLGFKVENTDGYAGHVEYGDGDKLVGVLAHVDTVAIGDGWTADPLGGEEKDGKIYGRGSYDDKGACIASIYALKALQESGVEINKKIRIIFGANEETGMQDIPYYLTKEKEPDMAFSPDSPFPVIYGEKGILNIKLERKINNVGCLKKLEGGNSPKFVPAECAAEFELNGKPSKDMVEALERFKDKKECSYYFAEDANILKITTYGKSANGTKPYEGINAISRMFKIISCLDFADDYLKKTAEMYNSKLGDETDGKTVECNFADDISTPLTLNVGTVKKDEDVLSFDIHIRYPVKANHLNIIENLKKNLSDNDTAIEISSHSPSHYVSKDSELVNLLMNIYREFTGQENAMPVTIEGGTYARVLKNAVGFGPLFPGEKQVAHESDEYVNIDSLIKAAKIYAKVLYEMSR